MKRSEIYLRGLLVGSSLDFMKYEELGSLNTDLKKLDESVQDETVSVFDSVTDGVDGNGISLESFQDVMTRLDAVYQEMFDAINQKEDDIHADKRLWKDVQDYFNISTSAYEFYLEFDNCTRRARENQLIIQSALASIPEDRKLTEGDWSWVLSLEQLEKRKKSLGRKRKFFGCAMVVWEVLYVATSVTLCICATLAAAFLTPPLTLLGSSISLQAPLTLLHIKLKKRWIEYKKKTTAKTNSFRPSIPSHLCGDP